jgi:CBS domain containing-hemolysin-like protein
MIVISCILLVIGVLLSAFFSGSETGFYRVNRVRLVIQNLEGDAIARRLLWLVNNPGWFVATSLVGNNVANYVTSLSIVLLTNQISNSSIAEMLAPIFMAPLLFVYGELLPKNLFFQAPNTLIRIAAPLFLFFAIVFAPASAVLWAISQLLGKLLGQAPEKVRLTLARRELQQVLDDGMEAGIIRPSQRILGQNFSLVASKQIINFCTPASHVVALPESATCQEISKLAARKELPDIVIYRSVRQKPIGYVRAVELLVQQNQIAVDQTAGNQLPERLLHDLPVVNASDLFGETLLRMQTNHETILKVINKKDGTMAGTLSIDQLTDPLLKGPLLSLRR